MNKCVRFHADTVSIEPDGGFVSYVYYAALAARCAEMERQNDLLTSFAEVISRGEDELGLINSSEMMDLAEDVLRQIKPRSRKALDELHQMDQEILGQPPTPSEKQP